MTKTEMIIYIMNIVIALWNLFQFIRINPFNLKPMGMRVCLVVGLVISFVPYWNINGFFAFVLAVICAGYLIKKGMKEARKEGNN